jgi:hypothetical protein
VMKVAGSLISAALPLVTTYFAALTMSSSPLPSVFSGADSAAWTATSSSS